MPNLFIDQYTHAIRDVSFGQMWVRIEPDGTHPVVFKIGFQYILPSESKHIFAGPKCIEIIRL